MSDQPAPELLVACVGAKAINGATYSHWLAVAVKGVMPGQRAPSVEEANREVLGFLISSAWVSGEAKDLGLAVSAARVKRSFDKVRAQQFHKRGEFEAYLRSSGETIADLLFRVELNLLSAQIQRHVVAGAHTDAAKQRELSRFVSAFKKKWQPQTYCASSYAMEDCGHTQASL